MSVDIICADAREALARFPDGHFHCCVTSPPFWGLRDYGLEPTVWGEPIEPCEHEWGEGPRTVTGRNDGGRDIGGRGGNYQDDGPHHSQASQGAFCRRCNAWRGTLGLEPTPELYVQHLVAILREVRRVLRDDGVLWLNLGDSYASQGGHASIEDDGRQNRAMRQMMTGIRASGIGLKPKDLVGVPWMVAFALRADGWWLRSDIIWSKLNPMPESVRDRPTRSHEYLFLLTKAERYYYDQDAIREPLAPASIERISQSTFDEQTGGPKDYRTTGVNRHRSARQGLEGLAKRYRSGNKERKLEVPTRPNDHRGSSVPWEDNGTGRNRRSVWEIATQPFPGAHFAVFPEKLVEPCILAGCPPAGKRCDCDDLIETPLGSGPIEDPSLVTGRAGLNRPRRSDEGVRPITRREQRSYAIQLRESPHWAEMATAAGTAFDHYIRTDNSGARPLSPDLLSAWLECGWLVHPGPCGHAEEPPGIVLDPFAGSGTVGMVAERLGRHSVLIDAKEEYCEMARHRTAQRGLMVEAL